MSYIFLSRFGASLFLTALVLLFFGSIYSWLSFRNIEIPFAVWVLTIGGFRFIWSVETPILPDLYLDRMAMIWLLLVVMIKSIAEGRRLRKPGALDALILVHGLYLLVRIYSNDMFGFHIWTMSYLVPYAAFFLAKNIVVSVDWIRKFLLLLLVLSVYYHITSIAEKFDLNFLLWPKYMAEEHPEFVGRSNGPFRQAPLFGTIIGMMLPIHLYFLATVRSTVVKGLLYLSMGLGFAGLYFTYTRGSWLVGLVALGVAAYLNRDLYLRRLLPLLVVLPILAVSVLGVGQDTFLKERVETDQTIDARVGVALTALSVWRDHPFLGAGFFSYRKFREDYVKTRTVPVLGTIHLVNVRGTSLHDIYLGPLAEDGLLGAIPQFLIYLLIFKAVWKNYRLRSRGDPFARYFLPIFAGLFVGYLVGGIVIDYRFFSFVGTLFYTCAGILSGYEPEPARIAEAGADND